MADPLRQLLRSIGALGEKAGGTISDAQLLKRFVRRRDEAAFELLVWRHGPMVLGVCRRLLADAHDAEDAFQTTFLVLVRKAASVCHGEALGSWLYQVAYRVALRLGAARAKRTASEQPGVEQLAALPAEDADGWEIRRVLDDEINRLPVRQRVAFVLCALEGKTADEAAQILGCPLGTVSSRLTRARARLRSRLVRRGLAPSGIATAVGLGSEALAAALPAVLLDTTVGVALRYAAGGNAAALLPAETLSHVEGVLRAMFVTKLKNAAIVVAALGMLVAGGVFARQTLFAQQPLPAEPEGLPVQKALQQPGGKDPTGPLVVTVVKPQRGPVERTTSQGSSVLAAEQVEIFAAIPGTLRALPVDIGTMVQRGQIVAEIDAPLLKLEEDLHHGAVQQAKNMVLEAEAGIRGALAEIEASKSAVAQRKAELDAADANLVLRKVEFDRLRRLEDNNAVDKGTVAQAEERLAAAKAQVASANAGVAISRADIVVKEGKLTLAEAVRQTARGKLDVADIGLLKARHMVSLSKIHSPIDGVVTRRNQQPGDLIRSAESGGQIPLLTIQRIDRVRVLVDIPERFVPDTEVGGAADLSFGVLPRASFKGQKIARTAFVLDPKTSTMRVEIDVANPDLQLRPGMSGNVTVHLRKGPADALRVPLKVFVGLSDVSSLHGTGRLIVVRGGKAEVVVVQCGYRSGAELEVLSGLGAEDLVIADPGPYWEKLKGGGVAVEVKQGGK